MPINFHIGGGHFSGGPWGGGSAETAVATMSSLAFMGNVRCVANLIFSGLLDRFPSLNFVSVESGLGWIPFLLEFCEYQFVENAVTSLELRPRDYFARQIYASYWFERDPASAIGRNLAGIEILVLDQLDQRGIRWNSRLKILDLNRSGP